MELKKAILVLADISGYTRFLRLHTMSLLHAEKIVTELMEAVIQATAAPLQLNKLEGDAVFLFAESGPDEKATARDALRQAQEFFSAFSRRSKQLTGCNNLCPCDACRQAEQLRLKTVLHAGEVAFKKIHNLRELAGEPVIVAHRLIKSDLPKNEYIMMTKQFAALSGGIGEPTDSRNIECDGIGEVPVEIYYPDPQSPKSGSDEKRALLPSIANAAKLDTYALARTLRLKKVRTGVVDRLEGRRRGFPRFIADGFRGLWMILRRK